MRRTALPTLLLAALVAGCADDPGETFDPNAVTSASVAGVTLEVPDSWEVVEDGGPAAASILDRRTWRPDVEADRGIHVVVGCGDATVDELVTGATVLERGGLQAADVSVDRDVEVVGLEQAARARIRFENPAGDGALTTAGLYGTVEDHLVLVELTGPDRGASQDLIDGVLGSVQVAPNTMPACPEPADG